MKTLLSIVLLICLSLVVMGCETLGQITVGDTTIGFMTPEQTAAIQNIQKSAEDITPSQEYYIGRAVAAVVLNKYTAYANANANKYLNDVGMSLAYASDRPETYGGYHFQIIDSDEINAFAAPGGLILVARGLLRCATSEDELAAILAHEISHVVLKHGLKAIKTSRITSALSSAALTAAHTVEPEELQKLTATFEDSITDITSTLINSGYSRGAESEADHGAVTLLQRVGYDPLAMVRMLQLMETKIKPGGLDFSKTHPDPKDRINDVQGVIKDFPPAPPAPADRQKRFQAAMGKI